MKTLKIILIFFLLSSLSSCLLRPHKSDIEQGNIITPSNVGELHYGMRKEEVKRIMGNPVMVNLFSPDRVDYVYTFIAGYGEMQEKRVVLIFRNNRLDQIITD